MIEPEREYTVAEAARELGVPRSTVVGMLRGGRKKPPRLTGASLAALPPLTPVALDREVYGPGRIAALCHVAPKTVCRWIDSGKLTGFTLPGGTERRVRHADLVAFMERIGFIGPPVAHLGVLLVAPDATADAIASRLPGIPATVAPDWFEAARLMESRLWAVAVVDYSMGTAEANRSVALLSRPTARLAKCIAVVITEDATPPEGMPWLRYPLGDAALDVFAARLLGRLEAAS